MKQSEIYVYGSNGFIGSNLIASSDHKNQFIAIKRDDWQIPKDTGKETTIVFLRACSSPTFVQANPQYSNYVNIEKTKTFLENALEHGMRIIFSSSDVVYGDTGKLTVDESATPQPFGLYAQQKFSIESHFASNPNFLSLRLSLVTGSGSKLQRILKNELNAAIPDPVIRNPINIDYLVLLIKVLSKLQDWNSISRILNVGGSDSMSYLELAKMESLALSLNPPTPISRTPEDLVARPATVQIDSSLAEDICGAKFSVF